MKGKNIKYLEFILSTKKFKSKQMEVVTYLLTYF